MLPQTTETLFTTLEGLPEKEVVRVELLYRSLLETDAMRQSIMDFPDVTGMDSTQTLFVVRGPIMAFVYGVIGDVEVDGTGGDSLNMIVNGGFDGNADGWALNTDWTYGSGRANAAGSFPTSGDLTQHGETVLGHDYLLEFDIGGTAGGVSVQVGNSENDFVLLDVGHYSAIHTSLGGGEIVRFSITSEFFGWIDNVSVTAPGGDLQIALGYPEDNGTFATKNIGDDGPIATDSLWYSQGMIGASMPLDSMKFVYLQDTEIKLYFLTPGQLTSGALSVQVLWWPLEPGATVIPIT